MLMLATTTADAINAKYIANVAVILMVCLFVMCLIVTILVPHERWVSMNASLRSGFHTLRGQLFWTRSKDDDLQ